MGVHQTGSPKELITTLQQQHGIQSFVESGTYYGETAIWASDLFDSVVTIERSEEIFQKIDKAQHPGIQFICGDTRQTLQKIVPALPRPALFWLDAHWSGGQTYGAQDECPLLGELEIINAALPEHFLLIDDARFFLSPPPLPHRPEQWPGITEIVLALQASHRRYVVIINDVIVAVPLRARETVIDYCRHVTEATAKTEEAPKAGGVRRTLNRVRRALGRAG